MTYFSSSCLTACPAQDTTMINAAVIGLGRWGKNIVESVQGKSKRLHVIRGVSKEPELVGDFAKAKGFELSTDFEEAIADPRVQAVFLATPHSLARAADFRGGGRRQAGLVRKAAGAHARRGRARRRRHAEGRRALCARQQQALLFLDARAQARGGRRHHRRGDAYRRQFHQRALDPRERRLARRPARIPGRRHDRRRAACDRCLRQSRRADRGCRRTAVRAEGAARSARRGGRAVQVRKRRHRHHGDRARRADVLAHHGVRHQRLGGGARGNDADRRQGRRATGDAGLSGGRFAWRAAGSLRRDHRNRQAVSGHDRRHARRRRRLRGGHPLDRAEGASRITGVRPRERSSR